MASRHRVSILSSVAFAANRVMVDVGFDQGATRDFHHAVEPVSRSSGVMAVCSTMESDTVVWSCLYFSVFALQYQA